MTVVVVAKTSKMTHEPDCEWVSAQEHNSALTFRRFDSTVDTAWFSKRALDLSVAETLGVPRPYVCQFCGCRV